VNAHQAIDWSVSDILHATGGVLYTGQETDVFDGFSTDSRTITPRECFICLTGDVHDGHKFIPDIIRQEVKGVIIQQARTHETLFRNFNEAGITCVAVNDTLSALGELASYHRHRHRPHLFVVALTGSNGKTSTRTMIANVVQRRYKTLTPFGNFNNLIAVPLTLLRIEAKHEWAILELGMNRPGEIRRLGQICSPDIGLITNIGPAHLEGLGSLEGIMNAKGEMLETVSPRGRIILNADDPMVMRLATRAACETILFGRSEQADIRATAVENSASTVSFLLHVPGDHIQVTLRVPGEFNISNALAAVCVGYCLNIPLTEIKTALEAFTPVKGRMNIRRTVHGLHLIDDTYNANPVSVKAAIRTLTGLSQKRHGIAVLGDMLELGHASRELHREVGRFAAESGLGKLYLTGSFAQDLKNGAREGGMAAADVLCGSKDEILHALKNTLEPKDWILIKGSRGMRMETLVQALEAEYGRMEDNV